MQYKYKTIADLPDENAPRDLSIMVRWPEGHKYDESVLDYANSCMQRYGVARIAYDLTEAFTSPWNNFNTGLIVHVLPGVNQAMLQTHDHVMLTILPAQIIKRDLQTSHTCLLPLLYDMPLFTNNIANILYIHFTTSLVRKWRAQVKVPDAGLIAQRVNTAEKARLRVRDTMP